MVRFTDFPNASDFSSTTFSIDVFDVVPDKRLLLEQLSESELSYDHDYFMFMKSESYDKDYFLFMKYLSENLSSNDGVEGEKDDGVEGEKDDEGEDPDLKLFFDRIRVDGNSYCVKGNGNSDIQFEVSDVSDDEWGCLDETNSREDVEGENNSDGENGDGRDMRALLERRFRLDHKQNSRVLRNAVENGKAKCSVKNVKNQNNVEREESYVETERDCLMGEVTFRSEHLHNVPHKRKRCPNGDISHVSEPQLRCDEEDDPCYKLFIENREKNVDSFAVDTNGKDRRNLLKKRLRLDHNRNPRTSMTVMENGKVEGRAKTAKNRNNVVREERFIETQRDCFMGEVNSRLHLSKASHKTKGCQNEHTSHVSEPEPEPKCDKEDDPCIKLFLGNCEKTGDSFALVFNGRRVEYEKDDNQSSSDSEIMVLDKAPDCMEWSYTPVSKSKEPDVQMEEDDLQCLGSRSRTENPLFRKEVMDILRKPFSQKEYTRLWQDVKLRKPIERHVDLRRGSKSFAKTEIGKSYLDHYSDVEIQLDTCKNDNPKRLNILRGFFFYLKKMSGDGVFKPWLDKSCLAIKPRTD